MIDPTRWSDAGDGATPGEQRLVRAGQDLPMPAQQKRAIWNQILGSLPSTPQPVPPDPHAPQLAAAAAGNVGSTALWVVNSVKTLGVLAAVTGIGVGGYHWLRNSRSSDTPPAAATVASATAVPIASVLQEPPVVLPSSSARTETRTAIPSTTVTPLPAHASQLREESLAVMAARQALRANDAGKALHLLEQARQRFSKGVLLEEREALTIEALARTGQSERASARAQAFVNRYPRSPHAADVQRFITK